MRLAPVLLVLAACGSPAVAPHVPEGAPRGVLVISVDSLRADHLSCYGYESKTAPGIATSPVIDARLAAEGARFTSAVSTTSWTVPGHLAMLGGQPDRMHGVVLPATPADPARRLLAQAFADAGWRTAGFYSGPNLDGWFGFDRGFEVYEDCTSVGVNAERFAAATQEERKALRAMEDASHEGLTSDVVVDRFTGWFDGLEEDEPFFAFLHFWDPHYDYAPPASHDLFDPDYTGDVDGTKIPQRAMQGFAKGQLSERDRDHVVALYDGEIRYTDEHIGRALGRLQAAGRLDDTLVVFTSDHGEEFGEHGRFGHNKTLFEESIEVPLIVRWPSRVPAGAVVDDLVSLVDLAPTVLDLVGLAPEPEHWGRSLADLLDDDPATTLAPRVAPLELAFGRPDPEKPRAAMEGLHGGDHKVVREHPGTRPVLFELTSDPDEHQRLAMDPDDPRLERAKKLWSAIRKAGERLPKGQGAAGRLPDHLEQGLQHFGYLGDDE